MSFLTNGHFDINKLPDGFSHALRVFITREKARQEVTTFFKALLKKPPVGRTIHAQSYARALSTYAKLDYDKALTAVCNAMKRSRFSSVYNEIEVFDNKGNKLGGRFFCKVNESLEDVADIVDTNKILDDMGLTETAEEKDLQDKAMEQYVQQQVALGGVPQQPAGNGIAH